MVFFGFSCSGLSFLRIFSTELRSSVFGMLVYNDVSSKVPMMGLLKPLKFSFRVTKCLLYRIPPFWLVGSEKSL